MKTVSVEELAAHLEEHLEEVRRGETLTVVKNGASVATIVPQDEEDLEVIPHDPAVRLQDFEPGPRPKRLDFDAVQWLIDERERERSGKKYGP